MTAQTTELNKDYVVKLLEAIKAREFDVNVFMKDTSCIGNSDSLQLVEEASGYGKFLVAFVQGAIKLLSEHPKCVKKDVLESIRKSVSYLYNISEYLKFKNPLSIQIYHQKLIPLLVRNKQYSESIVDIHCLLESLGVNFKRGRDKTKSVAQSDAIEMLSKADADSLNTSLLLFSLSELARCLICLGQVKDVIEIAERHFDSKTNSKSQPHVVKLASRYSQLLFSVQVCSPEFPEAFTIAATLAHQFGILNRNEIITKSVESCTKLLRQADSSTSKAKTWQTVLTIQQSIWKITIRGEMDVENKSLIDLELSPKEIVPVLVFMEQACSASFASIGEPLNTTAFIANFFSLLSGDTVDATVSKGILMMHVLQLFVSSAMHRTKGKDSSKSSFSNIVSIGQVIHSNEDFEEGEPLRAIGSLLQLTRMWLMDVGSTADSLVKRTKKKASSLLCTLNALAADNLNDSQHLEEDGFEFIEQLVTFASKIQMEFEEDEPKVQDAVCLVMRTSVQLCAKYVQADQESLVRFANLIPICITIMYKRDTPKQQETLGSVYNLVEKMMMKTETIGVDGVKVLCVIASAVYNLGAKLFNMEQIADALIFLQMSCSIQEQAVLQDSSFQIAQSLIKKLHVLAKSLDVAGEFLAAHAVWKKYIFLLCEKWEGDNNDSHFLVEQGIRGWMRTCAQLDHNEPTLVDELVAHCANVTDDVSADSTLLHALMVSIRVIHEQLEKNCEQDDVQELEQFQLRCLEQQLCCFTRGIVTLRFTKKWVYSKCALELCQLWCMLLKHHVVLPKNQSVVIEETLTVLNNWVSRTQQDLPSVGLVMQISAQVCRISVTGDLMSKETVTCIKNLCDSLLECDSTGIREDIWEFCALQIHALHQWSILAGQTQLTKLLLEVSVVWCVPVHVTLGSGPECNFGDRSCLSLASWWMSSGHAQQNGSQYLKPLSGLLITKPADVSSLDSLVRVAENLVAICDLVCAMGDSAIVQSIGVHEKCIEVIECLERLEQPKDTFSAHLLVLVKAKLSIASVEVSRLFQGGGLLVSTALLSDTVQVLRKHCISFRQASQSCNSKPMLPWGMVSMTWSATASFVKGLWLLGTLWELQADPRRAVYYLAKALEATERCGSRISCRIREDLARLHYHLGNKELAKEQLECWGSMRGRECMLSTTDYNSWLLTEAELEGQIACLDSSIPEYNDRVDDVLENIEWKQPCETGELFEVFRDAWEANINGYTGKRMEARKGYVLGKQYQQANKSSEAIRHFMEALEHLKGIESCESSLWSNLMVHLFKASEGTEQEQSFFSHTAIEAKYKKFCLKTLPSCHKVIGLCGSSKALDRETSLEETTDKLKGFLINFGIGATIRAERLRNLKGSTGGSGSSQHAVQIRNSGEDLLHRLCQGKLPWSKVSETEGAELVKCLYQFSESLGDSSDLLHSALELLLPESVVLCSMALSPDRKHLLLSRYAATYCSPIVVKVPASTTNFDELLETFDSIVQESEMMMKGISADEAQKWSRDSKKEWWENRKSLDCRMKEVIENIESSMLGPWKFLLRTPPKVQTIVNQLSNFAKQLCGQLGFRSQVQMQFVKVVAEGADLFNSVEELVEVFNYSLGKSMERVSPEVVSEQLERFWQQATSVLETTSSTTAQVSCMCSCAIQQMEVSRRESVSTFNDSKPGHPILAKTEIAKLKVVELKAELASRGLSTSGLKAVLADRLQNFCVNQEEDLSKVNCETANAAQECHCDVKASSQASVSREPLTLVMSSELLHLPWESTTVLRGSPCTRLPCISFALELYLKRKFSSSKKTSTGCEGKFVVDSRGDLPSTRAVFTPVFEGLKHWQGHSGQTPEVDWLGEALETSQVFVFCGHGSGEDMMRREQVANLKCKAAVLLMGCSSGKLERKGQLFDSQGMIQSFVVGGAPCVVANLWDVTDKDIDRFTLKLLEDAQLLEVSSDFNILNIVNATASARDACKLKYLIGAAPVCFGIPEL